MVFGGPYGRAAVGLHRVCVVLPGRVINQSATRLPWTVSTTAVTPLSVAVALRMRLPKWSDHEPKVHLLATWHEELVMARQGTVLVATFHPELSGDLAVHRYFLGMMHR